MTHALTWLPAGAPPVELECRVCAERGAADHVAVVELDWRAPFDVRRCRACGSLELLDDPLASSTTDEQVDQYIEGGAGIGTMADALALVDPATVRRFLDVGCNVGFALDLARFSFGWEVVGVEPSLAGRRGAAELDLDIRHVHLDGRATVGEPFDLVLASEVIEHVLDPLRFAEVLAAQLTDDGFVILTTPAAEFVDPAHDDADVLIALSPGLHVFVASGPGLERLLRRAGFASVRVTRRAGTLHVVASRRPGADLDARPPTIGPAELERYYDHRAAGAEPCTALANGMATRSLRSAVSRGAFDAAAAAAPLVIEAVRRRHGLDLTDPQQVTAALRAGTAAPWHLANAAYSLGMLALLHDDDPARAAALFELTTEATRAWHRQAGLLDLDSADLAVQGATHHALALARTDAPAAVAAALDLEATARGGPGRAPAVRAAQCRVFVDLVARGAYDEATTLVPTVTDRVRDLLRAEGQDASVVALDTLFSLGIVHLNTGRVAEAATWFGRLVGAADRRTGEHAAHLAEVGRTHLELARSLGAPTPPRAVDGWPVHPRLHHQIDAYWVDAEGVYLEGWAHLEHEPIHEITVHVGGRRVAAPPRPTPELATYWPGVAAVTAAGFATYVPGSPHAEVGVSLRTDRGEVDVPIVLPARQVPELPEFQGTFPVMERIAQLIADAPPGPVLAIGIRSQTEEILAAQTGTFGGREHVGVDIHPGLGVDVIGDVHVLSSFLPTEHFAVVYSNSVLEHLAMPWLVAAECAKVLVPGGRAIHVAPWTWPTHSQPNDFWRMSANGLRQLFGPAAGFRALDGGDINGTTILPSGAWRTGELRMATMGTAAASWIAAEKVDAAAADVTWPYVVADGAETAQQYPLDALTHVVPLRPADQR